MGCPPCESMSDETATGSAGTGDGGGPPGGNPGEQSPLQTRAAFLKNWDWQLVTGLNRGACERGRAQHGPNSESHRAVAESWEHKRSEELSLAEVLVFLRHCHRSAPFLFYNGNTFADIGRRLITALLADLPSARLRQASSAVAHYVAGVLDWESMSGILLALMESADFQPGDPVMTLRGSARGVVKKVHPDGRIVWKVEDQGSELISLPESLRRI